MLLLGTLPGADVLGGDRAPETYQLMLLIFQMLHNPARSSKSLLSQPDRQQNGKSVLDASFSSLLRD